KRTIPVAYQGLLPDLFREGQGVVAEGALDPAGIFRADSVLAKHDETYMPKDVADALKKQGHWKDDYERKLGAAPQGRAQCCIPRARARGDRKGMTMIAEFGHYALVLALALALVQASVPMVGARTNDPVLMAVAGPTAVAQFCFIAIAFAALTMCY